MRRRPRRPDQAPSAEVKEPSAVRVMDPQQEAILHGVHVDRRREASAALGRDAASMIGNRSGHVPSPKAVSAQTPCEIRRLRETRRSPRRRSRRSTVLRSSASRTVENRAPDRPKTSSCSNCPVVGLACASVEMATITRHHDAGRIDDVRWCEVASGSAQEFRADSRHRRRPFRDRRDQARQRPGQEPEIRVVQEDERLPGSLDPTVGRGRKAGVAGSRLIVRSMSGCEAAIVETICTESSVDALSTTMSCAGGGSDATRACIAAVRTLAEFHVTRTTDTGSVTGRCRMEHGRAPRRLRGTPAGGLPSPQC